MQNLIDLSRAGELPIEIVLVISSRAGVGGIDRAHEAGIPVEVIARKGISADVFDRRITDAVGRAQVELICLAGFLSKWTIPQRYESRVLNIHPALLPKFGGKGMFGHHVHEAVLAAGETESGCTVHVADNEYDHGPIILQRKTPVRSDDTPTSLADRVFEQECIAYPEAIRRFVSG